MRTNLAEAQFLIKKYTQAGLNFELVFAETKNEKYYKVLFVLIASL